VGLKSGGFNGRRGVVRGEGAGGRAQVSLLEAEGHEIDPAQGPIAVKPEHLASLCAFCFAPKPPNRCSRCKGSSYCGKECQLSGWRLHKEMCGEVISQADGTGPGRVAAGADASRLQRRAELLEAAIKGHDESSDAAVEISLDDLELVVAMGFERQAAEEALHAAFRLGGGTQHAVE
jgi:hypothetical protein